MKATELIQKLQESVNVHGDFDVKVAMDIDCDSIHEVCDYGISGWEVDFQYNDELNPQSSYYGGVISATYTEEDE